MQSCSFKPPPPVGDGVQRLQELHVSLLILKAALVGQEVEVLLVPPHVHQDPVLIWRVGNKTKELSSVFHSHHAQLVSENAETDLTGAVRLQQLRQRLPLGC